MDHSEQTLENYMKMVRLYLDVEYPVVVKHMLKDAEDHNLQIDEESDEIVGERGTTIASILYFGFVNTSSIPETAGNLASFYRAVEGGKDA